MHVNIEGSARVNLVKLVDDIAPEDIDPDGDMVNDYGLTSLNKVLFLMSLCNETGVELSHFTEQDLARMRTLRDVTEALARHADKAD
jgi:acyl carrier protein